MSRLASLRLPLLACLLGAAALPASAETLKVSSFLPPNHTFNRTIEAWGAELAEKSGGELTVELFPSAQLGPPPRQFDLVRAGAADAAVILHGATPGRFPMSELAGLPLSYPSAGQESAITSRRLTELAPDYLAEEHAGTRILWMAVTPPLKIHLAETEPASVESLEGLRIRYAGQIWQQMLEALGAAPMPVPPGETADAMSKGIVDGASFPYEATQSFDLAPVTSYSMEPGLASATFAVVMSEATYNGLSPELQKLVDATTGPDRAEAFGKLWDENEAIGRQYMTDGGVSIVTLPDAEVARLSESFAPIVEGAIAAVEADGKPARAFFEAYTE
jgi:TRAP-type C4-dicarboxylate transport system substrate-binding protein